MSARKVVAAVLLGCALVVDAHNWVKYVLEWSPHTALLLSTSPLPVSGPSRARVAGVKTPCLARVSDAPHIQVARGQEFGLEWSHGHGVQNGEAFAKPHYFVTIRASDEERLLQLSEARMDKYIERARAAVDGRVVGLTSGRLTRRFIAHRSVEKDQPGEYGEPAPVVLASEIRDGEADWMVRDNAHIARSVSAHRLGAGEFRQWRHRPVDLANDVRATFPGDTELPWVFEISKFYLAPFHQPEDVDATYFKIDPAWAGPDEERFLVYYFWMGYQDCIDIHTPKNVVAVQHPYGRPDSVARKFKKLDHCEFKYVLRPATECRVVKNLNAQAVLDECTRQRPTETGDGTNIPNIFKGKCESVQCVRFKNPTGTLAHTVSIPYNRHDETEMLLTYPRYCEGGGYVDNGMQGRGLEMQRKYGDGGEKKYTCKCLRDGKTVTFSDNVYGFSSCEACEAPGYSGNPLNGPVLNRKLDMEGNPECTCDGWTIHARRKCGRPEPLCRPEKMAATAADGDFICYGLTPYVRLDEQGGEDYHVTDDVNDPAFYSTCWLSVEDVQFDHPYPRAPLAFPVWHFSGREQACVSCAYADRVQRMGQAEIANWLPNLTEQCQHCARKA